MAYRPLQCGPSAGRDDCPGGCLPGGVCPGGVCPGGVWQTLPPWTEWQVLVKTLPCRNYVADGNETLNVTVYVQYASERV